MLKSLGFITGSALTAVLAMALTDGAAIDGLRRSAQQLFASEEPLRQSRRREHLRASRPATAPGDDAMPTAGEVVAADAPTTEAPMPVAATIAADTPAAPSEGDTPTSGNAEAIRREKATGESSGPAGDVQAEPQRPDPEPPGSTPDSEPSEPSEPVRDAETLWAVPADDTDPDFPADADEPGLAATVPAEPGGWHTFWTPFHSEASAQGFARHLNRSTGVDYRIIKTRPGEYRVAFWHDGDAQRSRRLVAIEQASGLNLRGGEL